MEPTHAFTDAEHDDLRAVLEAIGPNPYVDRPVFSRAVEAVVERGDVPSVLRDVTARIRTEREAGIAVHALRNCPLDTEIPVLDQEDPLNDKYAKKKTFVAEAFLELFGQLVATPLLAYGTRFNGDFFTDVIAINRYRGKQTGFSDGELAFHNDRTAHPVRADYITLLGMRCPEGDVTYTSFVGGDTLLTLLSAQDQEVLRQRYFITPFDVLSRDNNRGLTFSDTHPVFENRHSIRYVDTHTTVAPDAPPEAMGALLALKNAIVRSGKKRHRILTGDLFTFANQDGLHSRDHVEINDPERARTRWLLKTYAFRGRETADKYADRWLDGVVGRVGD